MNRRRINIICLQETRWLGEKSKGITMAGYKLWYIDKDRQKSKIRILQNTS